MTDDLSVDCVVVDIQAFNRHNLDFNRLEQEAIWTTDRKLQADDFPNIKLNWIRGTWYIPKDSKYATWLLVKYPELKTGKVFVNLD